jgi:methyl-accepting chemotaxis protein
VEGIAAESRLAAALATLVAEIPDAKSAFAAGDRERLLELFRDSFIKLKKDFGARQMQFHYPSAISFLRIHKPEQYGDDLSAIRKTIVTSNAEKRIITGLEVGVFGLGIRGVVQIYQADKLLGVVEFGMSFGQPFFDRFKRTHEVDLTLYLMKEKRIESFATTLSQPIEMPVSLLKSVLSGEIVTSQIDQGDAHLMVHMQAVQDFSGKNIGVLQTVMDRSMYVAEIERLGGLAVLMGTITLVIGLGVVL